MLQRQTNESSQDISIEFNCAATNHGMSRIQKVTGHGLNPYHAQLAVKPINHACGSIGAHIWPPFFDKNVELLLDRHIFYIKFLHLALIRFSKRIRPPCQVFTLSPLSRHLLAGYPGKEIPLTSLLHSHEAT